MPTRRQAALSAALVSALFMWNCGSTAPSGPSGGGGGGGTPPGDEPVQILAAGDVGECGFGALKTGAILDGLQGHILALGDLAYPEGTAGNFRDCYDPAWGRHKSRTRPVPGNHEYETDRSAKAYYDYFGDLAGPRGLGYYAFNEGAWRIIALNSELTPLSISSAQLQWLRAELSTNRRLCTLAYWHRPLFTSGPNFDQTDTREIWRTLHEFGVDIVLNGHDHLYERFAPQDPDGNPSRTGIRQFTSGTGGAHLYIPGALHRNSERIASVYGILILTLLGDSYQWDFASVDNSFRDTGSGACH
jgi:hypothetical protein